MTTVRFAVVCDKCGKRSPEYETWATCPYCCDDVCPACCIGYKEDEGRTECTACIECGEDEE